MFSIALLAIAALFVVCLLVKRGAGHALSRILPVSVAGMAMQQSKLIRVDYVDGGQSRVAIPRQHFLSRLRLKVVKGTFTGGTSPAFIASAGNKLITRMELVIGGQLTKDNLSFEDLRRLNLLQYRDTAGTEGYAYLDLGRLPTHAFTSLELLITWAALSTVTTGTPTTTVNTYVDVTRMEELNVGQDVKGIPLVVRKSITAAANSITEVKVDLRSGNVLQAVMIVPSSSTLIQSVSVIQDGVKYHLTAEAWADLREDNKADFELDALPSDFAVINFDKFGDGSQALRTGPMNTLEFVFATASEASQSIRLVPIEVAVPQ
jgi:hypothetical protein